MPKPPFSLSESFENSPRRLHLAQAGDTALPTPSLTDTEGISTSKPKFKQPLPILLQTFSAYSTDEQQHDFYFQLVPYFRSVFVKEGDLVWSQGDEPDGLFLIESGCLRATYQYEDHSEFINETMVAGTVAGEMTMLSGAKRNATVVAERDTQLWKLDDDGLAKLEKEKPAIARQFVRIAMKGEPCAVGHFILALADPSLDDSGGRGSRCTIKSSGCGAFLRRQVRQRQAAGG